MNATTAKRIFIWVFVIVCLITLWEFVSSRRGPTAQPVNYTDAIERANDSKVKQATIDGTFVTGTFADGTEFHTTIPPDDSLYQALKSHGANVTVKEHSSDFWTDLLTSIAPFVLLLALWFFLLRMMMRARKKAAAPPQDPVQ